MKKFFWIGAAVMLIAFTFYSCKKDAGKSAMLTEEEAAGELLKAESFLDFTRDFIPDVTKLLMYHNSVKASQRGADFLKQVSLANNDETKLADVYGSFSLRFDNVVLLKNKVDNDILRLLNQNTFLSRFTDVQTQNIIIHALDAARTSTDPKWQQAKETINNRLKKSTPRLFAGSADFDPIYGSPVDADPVDIMGPVDFNITWDEVWGCLKEAVGFGSASILGVAGLKKLASEGIQEIVIKTTSFLAKHAGWFGLAVTLIDFSACMYKESKD